MPDTHAHSRQSRDRRPLLRAWPLTIALVVIVLGVGGVALATRSSDARASATTTSPPARATPFTVVSVTPADGTSGVSSDATVTVAFTRPLATDTPTPTLTPPVAGTWQQVSPTTLAFVAAGPLAPLSTETVTVPAGPGGIDAAGGGHLAQSAAVHFTVAPGTTLRLQQLLAELGYLPVGFAPAGSMVAPQEAAQSQEGTFVWRSAEPPSLVSQWTPGASNVITTGAIMAFESRHGMQTDGIAGPAVWQQLLSDATSGTTQSAPYDYVVVSKSQPETATVYSNGAAVYSSPVNTGVPAAPTDSGTFPVYLRYVTTTMKGTNPDGSKYSDPGIPWVSYFNGGDALHGFVRGSYGFPQSDGCVEMPPSNAAVVYPLTPIGTLVTVS